MKLYLTSILHENQENLRVKDFYESHGLISQGLQGEGSQGREAKAAREGVTIGKGAR